MASKAKMVLVVDDSELTRAVITRILQQAGFTVITAGDGAEGAVTALRERPDAVVTDLDMPVMDGYQLARLLKSDPATADVPLLILTSHGEASSRFWGLETGADAYLMKSGLENELVRTVSELIEKAPSDLPQITDAPKTPLDVLARVSRQLDARLLEVVLANKIHERGVRGETLADASQAILETLAEIVDAWLLGLVLAEPESTTTYIRLAEKVSRRTSSPLISRMMEELEVKPTTPREVVLRGGNDDGRTVLPESLHFLPLPLLDARGLLVIAPKKGRYKESRDHRLLDQIRRNLALVLDNARLAQRLRELSMKDGLTRLFNRRTVHQRLCEEFVRAMRYGHSLSVALCDLDHFKQVNDTYGHQAGDAVLTTVAEILQHHARTPDVAGRYGGEEFLIVLPETELQSAIGAADRLRQTVAERRIALRDGTQLQITASVGVASLSDLEAMDVTRTPDALLRIADERLYKAKAAGRNQVIPERVPVTKGRGGEA